EGLELLRGEEVAVARDDLRLLRGLLLPHADGPRLLGPLVEIALELSLILGRPADGRGAHSLAVRILASDCSLPSSSRLSNSPGDTVEPVTASRMGWNACRGFSSRRAAMPRSAASMVAASNGSGEATAPRAA